MALPNFFSILDGREGDIDYAEVKRLHEKEMEAARLARLATEMAAAEQARKKEEGKLNQSRPNSRHSDNGRNGKWHRYNGQGGSSKSNGYNGGKKSNAYQQKQLPANGNPSGGNTKDGVVDGVPSNEGDGFQGNNRENGCNYQSNYRRNNGSYRGDYRGNGGNGYQGYYRNKGYQGEGKQDYGGERYENANEGEKSQVEDGWVPYSRRNNGRDFDNGYGRRGRGSNQGYYRNKSQLMEANEQLVNEGQVGRQTGNGEVDEKDAGDQVNKTLEDNEVKADGDEVSADGSVVLNEASKEEGKPKHKKQNGDVVNKDSSKMTEDERKVARARRAEEKAKEKAKEIEEDKKWRTLEQFEKSFLEEKKALSEKLAKIRLEKGKALSEVASKSEDEEKVASKSEDEEKVASKSEEKVAMDKDFDMMQPIHKKKEDEKVVEPSAKELQRKNNHGKDEKAVEVLKEFFNSSGGRRFERRGGQYEGRKFDGQRPSNRGQRRNKEIDLVILEDEKQFPGLGGSSAQ